MSMAGTGVACVHNKVCPDLAVCHACLHAGLHGCGHPPHRLSNSLRRSCRERRRGSEGRVSPVRLPGSTTCARIQHKGQLLHAKVEARVDSFDMPMRNHDLCTGMV